MSHAQRPEDGAQCATPSGLQRASPSSACGDGPLAAATTERALILVEGWLTRDGALMLGDLRAPSHAWGEPDLQQGDGAWAIVLRDIDWGEIARYPFVPVWDARGREAVFRFRVPDLLGVTCVHLESPLGELDWEPYASAAGLLIPR